MGWLGNGDFGSLAIWVALAEEEGEKASGCRGPQVGLVEFPWEALKNADAQAWPSPIESESPLVILICSQQ